MLINMMNKSKVYIVLPVYNWEKYLLDQLISIYEQSFKNWNLFIVNDWSKDNSLEIIENFISTYNLQDKVFLVSKENWWVNSAMTAWFSEIKKILKEHSNSYISYCDADDIWMRNKLEEQVKFVEETNCDLSYHDLIEIDEFNQIKNLSHENRIHTLLNNIYDQSFFEFCTWQHVTSTSIMFKSELLYDIYPFPITFVQDAWTMLVVSYLNKKRLFLDKRLWYYRVHSNSLSSNKKSRKTIVYWYKTSFIELKKRFNKPWINKMIELYTKREEREHSKYSQIHIILLIFKYNSKLAWFISIKPFKYIYYKFINLFKKHL